MEGFLKLIIPFSVFDIIKVGSCHGNGQCDTDLNQSTGHQTKDGFRLQTTNATNTLTTHVPYSKQEIRPKLSNRY